MPIPARISLGVVFLLIALISLLPLPLVAQTGPVGHWQFNEGSGTIAGDSSGNGNFGTLVNGPVWTTGFEGSAVSLDGADDYIEIGNAPALNPANALTLSVWVNPGALSSTQMVVAKYKIGLIQYFIRVQPGGRLRFSLRAGGAVTDVNSNAMITANAWHHIAGTYDGTQMRLYVDGVLDSFASKTGAMSDNGSNFNLGRHENNRMFYEGALDDFRIYDRALGDSEILALLNPGTGDTTPPVISTIATAGLTSVSVTITWNTDEQADSEVEYGLDTNYGQSVSDPALTTAHALGLSGLSADTTYHFRVISTDDSANTATSGDNVFTTPPVTSPPTMAFTQPSAGATITGPTVDVVYVASGDLTQADHAHLQLDGNPEVMDHDFDGFFQFANVPAGPHTLTGYIATLNHSKIAGTDASVSFTTVADTTPPTIVVTAPVDGAIVSGTISFAAAASDDVAVAGVQFKIDGTNVGAEDTTSPYSISLDTTTLTDGPYTLTAEARDTSNNMATSLAVAISVDNSLSAGLMAEWRFDDGSGVTAADSSGNGNLGTLLNGPSWVTGITNGGLSFDGVNDAVEVANDPALSPANTLTLSAWVNTNNLSSTQMVVAKYKPGLLQYFIRIHPGGRLRFALNAGGGVTDVNSNAALTANTWHHIAGTYDGSQMRFYIDGVLDAFASKSGPMTDNGSNFNLGRHENNVMFFAGLLDEVRIYNRAVSDTEVLALYNAGIQLPPADTTPPTVFVTAPASGSTISGTVTVTADASDNVGVAGVQFTLDGADLGAEDTTAPYSATWDTTSAANSSHSLSAVARDLAGNTNTASGVTVTVDNPVDTTPPIISGVSATSLTPSGVTIAWTTNEAADSQVEYGLDTNYGQFVFDPTLTVGHSLTITGLSPGTTYHFRVLSADGSGNSAVSGDNSFTTPVVANPPTMAFTQPSAGATISGPTVDVVYVASGDLTQADHAHLQLDGNPEVMDLDFDGLFQFTNVPVGPHTLTGYLATVNHGKIAGTDASVSFSTVADTTAPTVSLTAPADGAKVSGTITITADALDSVAVAGVQFSVDGNDIGAVDTSSPYSVTLDTTTLADSSHTLTAAALDTSGNVATDSITMTIDNAATIDPTLVAFWTLDDGSGLTATDSSGNGNDGALINGPIWTTGHINGALDFDGSDDYVDAGDQASLNPIDAVTISAWVNTRALTTTQMIVSKYDGPNAQYFLRIQSGTIRFNVQTNGVLSGPTSSTAIPANTWHHVAGVYDGSQASVYIDGVLEAASSKTGTMVNSGAHVNIGRQSSGSMYFAGSIDDVRIYNRSLDASEVVALFNNTTFDITPPTAAITSPADNSTVNGTIAVDVSAVDNVAIGRVELYVDGSLFKKDASLPYQFVLSTALFSNGPHTLLAKAVDTSNNIANSPTITLNVDNQASAVKYNIIFILSDDQRWDTMQYMPLTTALLGNESVIFNNSFVAVPLCCPSRASTLSGLYSHNHGVLENLDTDLFVDTSTIATWLKSAGYRTGLFGKYLNFYGELSPPVVPPGWDDWHAQVEQVGGTPFYNYSVFENGVLVNYGTQPQDYSTDVFGAKVVQFIESTPQGQPLFAYFSPRPAGDTPAPSDIGSFAGFPPWRPPSYNEADVSDKPFWVRQLPLITQTQAAVADTFHQQQLESLQALDRVVVDIIDALTRTGRLNNTVIIFTSDNGMTWGEHRWLNHKWAPYEESIRVPLWIRVPGIPGRSDDHLIVNVDFSPTFAEWAGVVPPTRVNGFSLATLLRDPSAPWPTERLLEYLGTRGIEGVPERRFRAVRTPQYIYAEYDNGDREFYDLVADPYQLTNAINDPTYTSIITVLRNVLDVIKNE